jgi:hypothetical protein
MMKFLGLPIYLLDLIKNQKLIAKSQEPRAKSEKPVASCFFAPVLTLAAGIF